MFTFEEYLTGWLIYMGLIIGVLAIFWWLTRAIPWLHFKQVLRLIVSAILLAPVAVPETTSLWAPAWIVGALELIFGGVEGFMPIGIVLLTAVGFALAVYVPLAIAIAVIKRKKQASPA